MSTKDPVAAFRRWLSRPPADQPTPSEDTYARNCRSAYRLVQDLDRCRHGRHEGDRCFDCPGGESTGNDLIRPGLVVGHDHGGDPLAMPERGKRHLREEWLRAGAVAAPEADDEEER